MRYRDCDEGNGSFFVRSAPLNTPRLDTVDAVAALVATRSVRTELPLAHTSSPSPALPVRACGQEEVVASSLEKRCTAKDEKAYLDQEGKMEGISPPGLAYVPDEWPDGRPKDVCGWQVRQ